MFESKASGYTTEVEQVPEKHIAAIW